MRYQTSLQIGVVVVCLSALLLCDGCVSVHMKSAQAGRRVTLPSGAGFDNAPVTEQALQSTLLAYADRSVTRIHTAWADFSAVNKNSRSSAAQASLQQSGTILLIASEPSVQQALIDMMIYMEAQSADLREYGPAPIYATFANMNEQIWALGSEALTAPELDELRLMINHWKQTHPDRADIRFIRLSSMVPIAGKTILLTRLSKGEMGRIAPISPETRTLEETGLLAERSLFILARMPVLARWNAEFASSEAIGSPEFQKMLSNTSQLAASSTSIARFTDTFPQQVRTAREALFSDLGTQEASAQRLMSQTQTLLLEARKTSESLQTTLAGVQRIVAETGIGGPSGGKRIDIESYARTAEQLRLAAAEANQLTRSVTDLSASPQFSAKIRAIDVASDRKLQTASSEMKGVVDHAILRAAELVGFIFLLFIAYKLGVRRLDARKVVVPAISGDKNGRSFGQKAS
jgi:hypothetical protein